MQIQIKGAKKKSRRIRESIKFFANKLMSKKEQKGLNIVIEITRKLPRSICGDALYDDGDVQIRTFPFENDWVMFRTLAHEMVHVKQYHLGQLVDNEDTTSTFNGKKYCWNTLDYYDYPWELEAMSLERGLTINFLKSKGEWEWNLMRKKESIYLLL